MGSTRRAVLLNAVASTILSAQAQFPDDQNGNRHPPLPPNPDEDQKLPNGKSQKDAIAKEQHEQALKDTDDLIAVAEQLRDELNKAGNYVVPVSSVKKTEDIEKLAKRIRGRLKG